MTRSIAICTLIAAFAVVLVCAIYNPSYLSDENEFLHHFVNHELLALLVIIMTITLASAASLHLEFNKIEERYRKRGLTKTRRGVTQGSYCLIALFLFATALVVIKPLLPHSETAQAIVNGIALILVLFNVLILLELTQLAFSIQPQIED
jgi:uncharacterized membrane protein YidH (DUF202 family)